MEEPNDKVKEKSDSLGNAMTIMNNLIQLTDEIDKSLSHEENWQTKSKPPTTESESSGISFPDLPDPDEFLESITQSKADSEPSKSDSNANSGNTILPTGTPSIPIVPSAKILTSTKKNMSTNFVLNLASKDFQVHNFINKIKLGTTSAQEECSPLEDVASEAASNCSTPKVVGTKAASKVAGSQETTTSKRTRSKKQAPKLLESCSIIPQKSALSDAKSDKSHEVDEEVLSNNHIQQVIQKTRMLFDQKKNQLLAAKHLLNAEEVDVFLLELEECLNKNELIEIKLKKPTHKYKADMILVNELVQDVKKMIRLSLQVKETQTGGTSSEQNTQNNEQNNASPETNAETRSESNSCDSSNKVGTDSSSSTTTNNKSENITANSENTTQNLEHEDEEIIELEVPPKVFPLIDVPSDDEDQETPVVSVSDRAVPIDTSDITVVPIDTSDITVVQIDTSDITVVPIDTSDITVVPSDTSDITVVPSDTSDITIVPSDTSDITVVRSDTSDVAVVSEQARIQNLAILNLINEVKISRQHQDTDTQNCDTSPQEETTPSSSQPPSSASKPSVRDRLGSKVSVKDRIGPVNVDSEETQRRAAGVSIRDRLGDRVETDKDGVLRVHIDNDLVVGDVETVETSGLLALGITSGEPQDTERLTDVFEKVFVRQVRIEASPPPAREISERNAKLPETARSDSGSPSRFPDDVDGFQTLSEAESDVGEDLTRKRKRRSAKDRLGVREPSSEDEDRHVRRDRDPSRHRSPHHRYSPHRHSFSPHRHSYSPHRHSYSPHRHSYSPHHRPSYSPPPRGHHPHSSHRPPYHPSRGHRPYSSHRPPYHPSRGHRPYSSHRPPYHHARGQHRPPGPHASYHRPRFSSPSRHRRSRSRSHSPPHSKRARYPHHSQRRYSPHRTERSRSPRHYPRRHHDSRSDSPGRFDREDSPRTDERRRQETNSRERRSGSVEGDQCMRYSRPLDSSHHGGPFNPNPHFNSNEGPFNPNPHFRPNGGPFHPNPQYRGNYNQQGLPLNKKKFNPRNFSDHLTPRDPNIIELVAQEGTSDYPEPSPIMEHQIPPGFIDPIPPPVDALDLPLGNQFSLPLPQQPALYSVPPPPLMIPPPLIPPHAPSQLAPVPAPAVSKDPRDPSFTLNFIEDNISKVQNNLMKKIASSKSKVDEYFEKWRENEPPSTTGKRERRDSPQRGPSARRAAAHPVSQASARKSISPLSLSPERSHGNARRFPLPPQRTPSPPSPPRYERPSRPTRNFIDLSPLRFTRSPSLEVLDRASPQRASHRRASPERVRRPERGPGPSSRPRRTPSPPRRSRSPLSVFGAHVTGCQGRSGRLATQQGRHGNGTTRLPSRSRSRSPRWDVVSPAPSSSSEFGNPLDLVENPGVPGEDDF